MPACGDEWYIPPALCHSATAAPTLREDCPPDVGATERASAWYRLLPDGKPHSGGRRPESRLVRKDSGLILYDHASRTSPAPAQAETADRTRRGRCAPDSSSCES